MHNVRGRPTLKDVERFRNGSVRELYERSQCDITSDPFIKNTIENKAYELSSASYTKRIHKHRRVSARDREPNRIPVRAMESLNNQSRKVRKLVYKLRYALNDTKVI